MKIKVPQPQARLFGRAGESVTRGDRRPRELEFESSWPPLTARPNRRRDQVLGWTDEASPLGGAPKRHEIDGEILTPVGHLFKTPSRASLRSETVRQPRNAVRQESRNPDIALWFV